MADIKLFAKKWKRIWNLNTSSENIQRSYRDRKMCHANNEKRKMRNDGAIEKEAYKNLGILETDTIKHNKMKEKM